MTEWPAPGSDGLTHCPAHAESGRFLPARGCTVCRSLPAQVEDAISTEMVEADEELEKVYAQDADERGLADMLELEELGNKARVLSRREASICRKRAAFCEDRGKALLDGKERVTVDMKIGTEMVPVDAFTMPAVLDAIALKWFTAGKDYRMAVQKAVDTQAKLIKANMPAAAARYRAKKAKELAVLKAKGRAN